jgi:hypothetical protein
MFVAKLAVALVAVSPLAASGGEETVASLAHVEGNVLVSTGAGMESATAPARLLPGMRVLPSWRSFAVVLFDDGCRVLVEAGQRYEVEKESPCAGPGADGLPAESREAQ